MQADCAWPVGQVAVSLTYDDNAPTQLTTAIPALRAHNLRATFFINDVRKDPEPWREVASNGHELGSHTMHHPCPPADWVPEGFTSYDYDLPRMAAELDASVRMLRDLGQSGPLTFAYPCGVTWVGKEEQSYVHLVQARFMAARGVTSQVAGASPDLMNVPAFLLKESSQELISQVEKARAHSAKSGTKSTRGMWVVFGFHGVGGDWEIIAPEEHEALLAYLDAHRTHIHTAPFGEIARCWARD
jgi:peptidoglycan/xylan/chitin deacetylase (PgdA/CDA1 family)